MEYRIIDRARAADIRLKNEPFPLVGRLVVSLGDGAWAWREELRPEPGEMRFPDEDYDYDAMARDHLFLGAYDEDGRCLGLAVLRDAWFRYMYIEDLKVCRAARGRGVGAGLVAACMDAARARGYAGLSVIAQDDNLLACRFYLKQGFAIGGYDNRVYRGTAQEGKGDVVLYKEGIGNRD